MSAPTKQRPRGKLSKRAVSAWNAAAHNGFVHSAPDSNLPKENLPRPTEPRFPTSLNAVLCSAPHLELAYLTDDIEDGQIVTQSRNRAAAIERIAGEKFNPCDLGSGLLIQ